MMKKILLTLCLLFLSVSSFAGQANLAWNAPAAITTYNLYYGTVKGGPYPAKASTLASTPSISLTGLIANQQYCFITKSQAGTVESPGSAEACATASATGTLTVSITPTAITGYNIYYGLAPGSHPTKQASGLSTTATVTGLNGGQNYCFVMRAAAGALESLDSNEACAVIPFPQSVAPCGPATDLSVTATP